MPDTGTALKETAHGTLNSKLTRLYKQEFDRYMGEDESSASRPEFRYFLRAPSGALFRFAVV